MPDLCQLCNLEVASRSRTRSQHGGRGPSRCNPARRWHCWNPRLFWGGVRYLVPSAIISAWFPSCNNWKIYDSELRTLTISQWLCNFKSVSLCRHAWRRMNGFPQRKMRFSQNLIWTGFFQQKLTRNRQLLNNLSKERSNFLARGCFWQTSKSEAYHTFCTGHHRPFWHSVLLMMTATAQLLYWERPGFLKMN